MLSHVEPFLVPFFRTEKNNENHSSQMNTPDKADTDYMPLQPAYDLIARKDEIETEMDSIFDMLESEDFMRVGLSKPLVDENSFPIAGIDLLAVRQHRNRFAVLRTDLMELELEIEKHLHQIHEIARNTGNISRGESKSHLPFGRVETVVGGSAAELSGIMVGDLISKFGPLSCYSESGVERCYESIPSVLGRHDSSNDIEVLILRRHGDRTEVIRKKLLPRGGRIGCLIKPINVR